MNDPLFKHFQTNKQTKLLLNIKKVLRNDGVKCIDKSSFIE